MNSLELVQLADKLNLNSDIHFELRIKFGLACIERVEHLITDNEVFDAFLVGKAFVSNESSESDLCKAATRAAKLASSHSGSNSIDGSGSAAVTTSRGVASALAGRALQAASYSAYASVYSYASYAVTDPSAYETEYSWQVNKLISFVNDIKD